MFEIKSTELTEINHTAIKNLKKTHCTQLNRELGKRKTMKRNEKESAFAKIA